MMGPISRKLSTGSEMTQQSTALTADGTFLIHSDAMFLTTTETL